MNQVIATAVPDVDRLSAAELLELFRTLPAPTLAEMQGEYAARLLRQPTLFTQLTGQGLLHAPLLPRWRAKAFRPVDAGTGRGYNTFAAFGRILQRYPMHTLIAPSRFDGQPAFQLVYRHFRSLCGFIHMVDEVRRLGDGRYLGIGTWGFSGKQRQVALPFLLEGPVGPYRGDIGDERRGFDICGEVPALRAGR